MADERTPTANIAPFGLRMQPDLKARVEEAARANNRSLNAEIVHRVEDYPRISLLEVAYNRSEQERKRLDNELAAANRRLVEMPPDKERLALVAERMHLEATRAAQDEVKEAIDREMESLMDLHRSNNKQLETLELLREEIQSLIKEKQELNDDKDNLINEQARVIETLRGVNQRTGQVLRRVQKAFDDAARGKRDEIEKLIQDARNRLEDDYADALAEQAREQRAEDE